VTGRSRSDSSDMTTFARVRPHPQVVTVHVASSHRDRVIGAGRGDLSW
jgi:hypothetical protein